MSISIVYQSLSGNTKLLAEAIRSELPKTPVYFGTPCDEALNADKLFIGFWTNKGTAPDDILAFLKKTQNKKVFLFGTAGFGGSQSYFDEIIKRVSTNLPDSTELIGSYMCQGKMPAGVKKRYESMLLEHPEDPHLKVMVENFDAALSHPDQNDLDVLIKCIKPALSL